mmetsp:Transcript_13240/g.40703  ORF Transcript_13240/g.40703 Transcript_13240/m.40703 type:complete len:219 (-) Transcript_13240:725-1381(-)
MQLLLLKRTSDQDIHQLTPSDLGSNRKEGAMNGQTLGAELDKLEGVRNKAVAENDLFHSTFLVHKLVKQASTANDELSDLTLCDKTLFCQHIRGHCNIRHCRSYEPQISERSCALKNARSDGSLDHLCILKHNLSMNSDIFKGSCFRVRLDNTKRVSDINIADGGLVELWSVHLHHSAHVHLRQRDLCKVGLGQSSRLIDVDRANCSLHHVQISNLTE